MFGRHLGTLYSGVFFVVDLGNTFVALRCLTLGMNDVRSGTFLREE